MTSRKAHCALSCAEGTGQSLGMSMTSRRSQSLGGKLASHNSEDTWDRAAASAAVASTASTGLPPSGHPSKYRLPPTSARNKILVLLKYREPIPDDSACRHCVLRCRGADEASSREPEERSDASKGKVTVQPHAPGTAATPLPEPVLTAGRQPSKQGRCSARCGIHCSVVSPHLSQYHGMYCI